MVRKLGMGSTGILFQSLNSGAIDVYSDYTGTLAEAILKNPQLRSVPDIRAALVQMGIVISEPLGFDNTYALAVPEAFARREGLHTISDLARLHATLRAGFSYEFMDRQDGYPGLAERYQLGLDPAHVSRMEHSLTYQAIDQGAVDVIDVYSTDAKIRKFKLRVLEDNLSYFPSYQAVWVARAAFVAQYPAQWRALRHWEGRINAGDHHAGAERAGGYRQAQRGASRRRFSRYDRAHSDSGRTDRTPDPRASVAGGRLAGLFHLRRDSAGHPRRTASPHGPDRSFSR